MQSSSSARPLWLRQSLLALVVLGLAVGAWLVVRHSHSATDHDHGQGHDHSASTGLTLNDGQRWPTDAPLRTGMQRIREAVDRAFAAHRQERFTAADAKALNDSVQENVNYLIANCKLAPAADATLHVLITEMLSGAAQVAANPTGHEGFELLAGALRKYPEYFEHPGWVPFAP